MVEDLVSSSSDDITKADTVQENDTEIVCHKKELTPEVQFILSSISQNNTDQKEMFTIENSSDSDRKENVEERNKHEKESFTVSSAEDETSLSAVNKKEVETILATKKRSKEESNHGETKVTKNTMNDHEICEIIDQMGDGVCETKTVEEEEKININLNEPEDSQISMNTENLIIAAKDMTIQLSDALHTITSTAPTPPPRATPSIRTPLPPTPPPPSCYQHKDNQSLPSPPPEIQNSCLKDKISQFEESPALPATPPRCCRKSGKENRNSIQEISQS